MSRCGRTHTTSGCLKKTVNSGVAQFDNQEIPEDGGTFQNRIPKGKELNAWREALRRAAVESDSEPGLGAAESKP